MMTIRRAMVVVRASATSAPGWSCGSGCGKSRRRRVRQLNGRADDPAYALLVVEVNENGLVRHRTPRDPTAQVRSRHQRTLARVGLTYVDACQSSLTLQRHTAAAHGLSEIRRRRYRSCFHAFRLGASGAGAASRT